MFIFLKKYEHELFHEKVIHEKINKNITHMHLS